MGDSVSSTAVFLPYSALAAPNSRSSRGISSIPTTVRTREILPRTRIRNGGSQLITACSRSNEAEMKTAKSRVSLNINRHPIPSGSGEYDLYDELGFVEKEKKQIDFEPTPDDKQEKKIDIVKGTKASSGVKFVQFKEESYAKSVRRMKDEELVITEEGSEGVVSELEELERRNGAPVAGRRGRQLMKRSNMLAKQVISMQSALCLGFVSQLWVDTVSWVVLVVEVRPNLLSGERERFFLEDVSQVGDVVLIQDESVIENDLKMVGLETLVGYNVVTRGRQSIGKVRGYTFNINSGAVESLELDSFGISIVPSSLVSTYALLVEDVLEVVSDTIVVHQAAASCMQRLTKGFWDPQKLGNFVDELGEHSDFERQPVRQDQGRNRRRNLFRQKVKETADEWELPMDYL